MAALSSYPASIAQFVGQVDLCEEVRSYSCQRLYFSLYFTLLHQFHLQKQQHTVLVGSDRKLCKQTNHRCITDTQQWKIAVTHFQEANSPLTNIPLLCGTISKCSVRQVCSVLMEKIQGLTFLFIYLFFKINKLYSFIQSTFFLLLQQNCQKTSHRVG